MYSKIVAGFLILFVLALLVSFAGLPQLPRLEVSAPEPVAETLQQQETPQEDAMIRLVTPLANDVVASPLTITGLARGNWFFEASFPVHILDATGMELGMVPAIALGEWMTTEFVPFQATLVFATSTTDTGTLVLEKDNPSGLPEHADEHRIPIRFRRE